MTDQSKNVVSLAEEKSRRLTPQQEAQLQDISAQIMGEAEVTEGFTYAGFCVAQLPHKQLKSVDDIWVRECGGVTLVVEPGTSLIDRRVRVGVPYGARARLFMLFIQTQAIRHDSPVIELGPNAHRWLRHMGLATGGRDYAQLREQMERIISCRITFSRTSANGRVDFVQDTVVSAGSIEAFVGGDDAYLDQYQPVLWNETIRMTDSFFEELKRRPVLVREEAIKALAGYSQALDVYIWLANFLPRMTGNRIWTWQKLYEQFGVGYSRQRDWQKHFAASVGQALSAYEGANVLFKESGLLLKPSPSPLEAAKKRYQIPTMPKL